MKKEDIKNIKEQVMNTVMEIEKEVMKNGIKEIDGTEEITRDEAVNIGKMLVLVDVVRKLEELFNELEK